MQRQEEQLPHPYPRVLALARAVTAHDTTTYAKVQSLIHWIGAHTHYSENIPPLPAGADTVDEFLFGNRVGFCEQISTSLAVMLRSLGIPAREAVGYVPGGYNPITDLYQVHADDAHAWVQVWFPGYGWQNFDPTAAVPLSAPSPGSTALHDVALGPAPRPPGAGRRRAGGGRPGRGPACAGAGPGRRRGRSGWRAAPSAPAVAPAGRAGPSETLAEYAARLDEPAPDRRRRRGAGWRLSVEASAYGGHDPPPAGAARHGRRGQAHAAAPTRRRRG